VLAVEQQPIKTAACQGLGHVGICQTNPAANLGMALPNFGQELVI